MMSVDGDLFDGRFDLQPFQRHSDTSKAAASAIAKDAAGMERDVLRALKDHPDGMTDEEIQDAIDMNPSTERPRRVGLVNKGLVRDSGFKRKTRSGRGAVVWIAV